MGKRTKYQREDIAQLYLVAKSSILNTPPTNTAVTGHTEKVVTSDSQNNDIEISSSNPDQIVNSTTESADSSALIKGNSNTTSDGTDNSDSWKHGEWEMGRRLVSATAAGEEAALREVRLDDVDGG